MERFETNSMDKILSVKATCEVLSTSRSTLWRLNKNKVLKARRLGGRVAYLKSEIEAFIAGLPPAGGIHCEQQKNNAETQNNVSVLPRSAG